MYICDYSDCCGCMACLSVCGQKAIDIFLNEKGFQYPRVNLNKCTNCNACKNVCPALKCVSRNSPKKIISKLEC